jgi:VPS28 protein
MCWNVTMRLLRTVQVPDVGDFMRQHSMQCPMALQWLVVVGLPATVEHGGGRSAPPNSAAVVAEITAAFITCLDSVRLNMLAVDQVPRGLAARCAPVVLQHYCRAYTVSLCLTQLLLASCTRKHLQTLGQVWLVFNPACSTW